MAYEANGMLGKNAESYVEMFSMMSEHSSWLTKFYAAEMKKAFYAWSEYSAPIAKNMGSIAVSFYQMGFENVKTVNKTQKQYSAKAEVEPIEVQAEPVVYSQVTPVQEKTTQEKSPSIILQTA